MADIAASMRDSIYTWLYPTPQMQFKGLVDQLIDPNCDYLFVNERIMKKLCQLLNEHGDEINPNFLVKLRYCDKNTTFSPLTFAASCHMTKSVTAYAEANCEAYTPIQSDSVKFASTLLANGADANFTPWLYETLVNVISNKDDAMHKLLSEHGVDFTAIVKNKLNNLLHVIVLTGDTTRVASCLDAGADVNSLIGGDTPLHRLVKHTNHTSPYIGTENVCRLLLERGADLSIKDAHGKNPLECVPNFLSSLIPVMREYGNKV